MLIPFCFAVCFLGNMPWTVTEWNPRSSASCVKSKRKQVRCCAPLWAYRPLRWAWSYSFDSPVESCCFWVPPSLIILSFPPPDPEKKKTVINLRSISQFCSWCKMKCRCGPGLVATPTRSSLAARVEGGSVAALSPLLVGIFKRSNWETGCLGQVS